MTIDELKAEAQEAEERFWFIQDFKTVEQTDTTVTLHFIINPELFIQIFFSQRNGRYSLTLVGATGRLYGRDREHGIWHLHPFGDPEKHELTPEGLSPKPISQFLAEVEKILTKNDLI